MQTESTAIEVRNLRKTFRLPHEQYNGAKQLFVNFFNRQRGYEIQEVLSDVSFEVKKGQFFGIVGRNGSGKSTLLKLLAGIYTPDAGYVRVNGSLTPFIELGVGFNPELTGRENVYMNGALLGFSRKEMEGMYDAIVSFAELENFMDQKLKNYSSGMHVRLAFSIAIKAKSDILLLDEVLAVGDAVFQKKCFDYFKQLKKEGRTVVFVSHDTAALQEYCDSGLLVEKGEIVFQGKIDDVINKYVSLLNPSTEPASSPGDAVQHIGTGDVRIQDAKLVVPAKGALTEKQADVVIDIHYEVLKDVEDPIFGLTIHDGSGERVFAGNNLWSHQKLANLVADQKVTIRWTIPNVFPVGTFSCTPAVATSGGAVMLDQANNILKFDVQKRQYSNAHTNVVFMMELR